MSVNSEPPTNFLPVSRQEMEQLGWDRPDVILVSGDAYVDHPSFGTAVMGRVAEYGGMRVAILPQPNCRDDLRDFKKLGAPRYFFGVTAGAMDSMVNHYTALRRRRSDDAYTPGGRPGYRPDMPSVVYTRILKQLYPNVPVVLGGVEASMRRFAHYDYWQDKLRPSILAESGADMLVYGMGEQALLRMLALLEKGVPFSSLHNIPQTAYLTRPGQKPPPLKGVGETRLPSFEECLGSKKAFAAAFRLMEEATTGMDSDRLVQAHADRLLVVNPPFPPPGQKDADLPYDLPYTRMPHPKYRNKPPIPAWVMIRNSVTLHRGCFGGCSFCAIAAHQGKFVVSRSEASVLRELAQLAGRPWFTGHVSDLGGPSANMYRMGGVDGSQCRRCRRPSCIHPSICPNLNYDHHPLIRIYDQALKVKGIKKVSIGSGVRTDMLTGQPPALQRRYGLDEYTRKLLTRHVSGRLKVAPEHSSPGVLHAMRKPPFSAFKAFYQNFRQICRDEGLPWQLVPYLISGHPGCHERDMRALAAVMQKLGLKPEQVQEFTPTPMTLATTMYYTGMDPYTGKKIYSARTDAGKRRQKMGFLGKVEGSK